MGSRFSQYGIAIYRYLVGTDDQTVGVARSDSASLFTGQTRNQLFRCFIGLTTFIDFRGVCNKLQLQFLQQRLAVWL